jgi:hypothetical protein
MELRIAGLLLLMAGWMLMLASVVMLSSLRLQTGFALAGFAVELLGFVLLASGHLPRRKRRNA